MIAFVALLGLGTGWGLWLLITGWSGSDHPTTAWTSWLDRFRSTLGPRAGYAAGGGLLLAVTTRWPVAALAGVGLGWCSPSLFGGRAARERAVARTEAIACWAESLRDTMSGARGLEAALASTAPVAPAAIRPELTTFAERLYRMPLPQALARLADDLAHPTADLVVTALSMAASGSVRDLGELLGTLAVAARDEAAMRLRVEAARERMRTAVKVIAGCTLATAGGLVALNPAYVAVYRTGIGQAVLAMIAAVWGTALWWLARMSDFVAPERFLVARREVA
jgi:tight adherence protein B